MDTWWLLVVYLCVLPVAAGLFTRWFVGDSEPETSDYLACGSGAIVWPIVAVILAATVTARISYRLLAHRQTVGTK